MKNGTVHTGVNFKEVGSTHSIDGMWRAYSATLALLTHAYSLIETAEHRLLAQDARISQLEELAMTDPLTGLYNRRGFDMQFHRELDMAERYDTKGGLLILFDLNHFKEINDTYGHPAGDACLDLVGTTLAQEIRKVDVAARLGGDEFALLLTQTDPEPALRRARTLLMKLNSLTLDYEGHVIPILASIGTEIYTQNTQPEDVYAAADKALYAHKKPENTSLLEKLLHGLKAYTHDTQNTPEAPVAPLS